jgi:hypothetical protein
MTEAVKIPEEKFVDWWSEAKLDQFEAIKYALIDIIIKAEEDAL